jgi:hypothetical protein
MLDLLPVTMKGPGDNLTPTAELRFYRSAFPRSREAAGLGETSGLRRSSFLTGRKGSGLPLEI